MSTPTDRCSADVDLLSQNSIESSMVIGSSLDAENVANLLHSHVTIDLSKFLCATQHQTSQCRDNHLPASWLAAEKKLNQHNKIKQQQKQKWSNMT